MADHLVDRAAEQVLQKISEARDLRHRLILVVGPAGSGKTLVLREVSVSTSALLVNVNLELSRQMLDLTEHQRTLQLPRLLSKIVNETRGELVLPDNTEILFDVHLQQDPLRLLKEFSRNKTVVAAWNGSVSDDRLIYADPGHPEYRRYPIKDPYLEFLVVELDFAVKRNQEPKQ